MSDYEFYIDLQRKWDEQERQRKREYAAEYRRTCEEI